jgi:hypothetical protein
MNVLILGAGASKSYGESLTGVRMPIANDFFETFRKLDIAEDPRVLIGWLLNYLKTFQQVDFLDFLNYSEDIEVLHSEIQDRLVNVLERQAKNEYDKNDVTIISAYTQLIFLFASVINEIQNGLVSPAHVALAKKLKGNDVIITFNWDALMDRALKETTSWNPETGYFIRPKLIFRSQWLDNTVNETENAPLLIKLHGSTNWLTSYVIVEGGKMNSIQNTDMDEVYVYESTVQPYLCYGGRYMSGYTDYSYGYYPPNLPVEGKPLPDGFVLSRMIIAPESMPKKISEDKGLNSMPLIIPPVKHKEYDYFGSLFHVLWEKSEESLIKANKIIIIGYSFPVTDKQTDVLFRKTFVKRQTYPLIIIVNPVPEPIAERFRLDYGIPQDHIIVYKEYFSADMNLDQIFS